MRNTCQLPATQHAHSFMFMHIGVSLPVQSQLRLCFWFHLFHLLWDLVPCIHFHSRHHKILSSAHFTLSILLKDLPPPWLLELPDYFFLLFFSFIQDSWNSILYFLLCFFYYLFVTHPLSRFCPYHSTETVLAIVPSDSSPDKVVTFSDLLYLLLAPDCSIYYMGPINVFWDFVKPCYYIFLLPVIPLRSLCILCPPSIHEALKY